MLPPTRGVLADLSGTGSGRSGRLFGVASFEGQLWEAVLGLTRSDPRHAKVRSMVLGRSRYVTVVLVSCAIVGCFDLNRSRPSADAARPDGGAVDTLSASDSADGNDAASGPARWDTASEMLDSRRRHSVTVLADGTVLVVGGSSKSGKKNAERYEPTSGKWSPAGQMSVEHQEHTATLLTDGRVLVAGGCGDAITSTCMIGVGAEIYDPKATTNPWSVAAPMPRARRSHRATRLADGRVVLVGGFDNLTNHIALDIYNPQSNSWTTPTASLSVARNLASVTTLDNGLVLIAGGTDGNTFHATIEVFDPVGNVVKLADAQLAEARASHTATLLRDGAVLFTGGICTHSPATAPCAVQKAEIYRPLLDQVTAAGSPGGTFRHHTATLLRDGRVLLVGGLDNPLATTLFTPQPAGWSTSAAPSVGRYEHDAALMTDGRVIAVGGADGTGASKAVEVYTP